MISLIDAAVTTSSETMGIQLLSFEGMMGIVGALIVLVILVKFMPARNNNQQMNQPMSQHYENQSIEQPIEII